MAIDPNIKKKADDIRKKIYGKEVRESLASGLEAMSSDVTETISHQRQLGSQFQTVIDGTTGKDVISAPEIIAARNGEANLKTRIDKDHQEVTAHLAQIAINIRDYEYLSVGNEWTLSFEQALRDLPSGAILVVPKKEEAYYVERINILNKTGIYIFSNGAEITQKEHNQSEPSDSQPTINVLDSEHIKISGLVLNGNHLNTSAPNNIMETGIWVERCKNITIENVEVHETMRGFRTRHSSNVEIINCYTDTTRIGFHLDNGTENSVIRDSVSNKAHYNSDHTITEDSASASAGYAFLLDTTKNCLVDNCISYKGGSECFRVQSSEDMNTNATIRNCTSFKSKRYAFSVRGTNAKNVKFIDCTLVDLADPDYWNGEEGSYTQPSGSPHVLYLQSEYTEVDGFKVVFTKEYSLPKTAIRLLSDKIKINNLHVDGDFTGIISNRSAGVTGFSLTNSFLKIRLTETPGGTGVIVNLTDSFDIVLDNNTIENGRIAISTIRGSNHKITNNNIRNMETTGISCGANQSYIDGNHVENVALLQLGRSYDISGGHVTMGTNTANTVPEGERISHTLRVQEDANKFYKGVLIEEGYSLGVQILNEDLATPL